MNTLKETTNTSLLEGFVGCIVAATYTNGQPLPEDYDKMIESIAGRDIFLDADITSLLKSQMTLRYVLDEDEFIKESCSKITSEWKHTVFAICCNLIMERKQTHKTDAFFKTLQSNLLIEVKKAHHIKTSFEFFHKGKV